MAHRPLRMLAALTGLVAGFLVSPSAEACGGFFCSQSAPVNQAAERIIFADNGDGTVTAVIQIMYQGPSEHFSWLLPISTVPQGDDIDVASDIAFQRLQSATNPLYTLTTRIEGECASESDGRGTSLNAAPQVAGTSGPVASTDGNSGVTVEATGVVGSFEWTVISLDDTLDDPADAAVNWLNDNDYDVVPEAPELIGPYLEDGMYLLALKLVKGADTGSIRPIVLTYEAEQAMIPIKLTSVAANDDMGVMAWLAGESRGVPQNYFSLELNEAKINWFNASATYNDVVNDAADEANGQGFVTEFAGPASQLSKVVWTDFDEQQWTSFSEAQYSNLQQLFNQSTALYSGWDGFWEAVGSVVVLPEGVSTEDFRLCPTCYTDSFEFSPSEYLDALESMVIEPVRKVQALLDDQEYVTRLYTTMSAGDMTLDPLFIGNPDLDDVSNVHTAERVIECSSDFTQAEAPWRIELPQGSVVRGSGTNTAWPTQFDTMPANMRVLQMSASGPGMVATDNTEEVSNTLDAYNATQPNGGGGCACSAAGTGSGSEAGWLTALALTGVLSLTARRRRRAGSRRSSRTR